MQIRWAIISEGLKIGAKHIEALNTSAIIIVGFITFLLKDV